MNVLRRFARSVVTRAATMLGMPISLYQALAGSRSIGTALTGVRVDDDSALKVSAFKRGVELIANYIGKTPFHVKRNREKQRQHPAWKLVRKWAQYHQLSAFEFRRTLVIHALTRGNGYAYIVRDADYTPTALRILDPGKVTPMLKRGRLVYRFDGSDRQIRSENVIHIRGVSKDGFVGLDPIKTYATDVLGLSLAQTQYASTYYSSGGSPSMYLHTETMLEEDHFNRLKSETGPLKRSLDNPHDIPVIDGAELKSLSLSAEQTQLLGSREFALKDIANVLNISVHKLNGEGTGGYKSVEEENNAFRDDTLDPWFCQFEIEYEKLLTEAEQADELVQIEAVRESLTRSNMSDRANYLTKAIGGPWMTPAEGRDVDSLTDIPDTDTLYPPPNMTRPDTQTQDGQNSGTRSEHADTDVSQSPHTDVSTFTLKRVAALEDVFARMLKRVTVAARTTAKRTSDFTEFCEQLEVKHGDVMRAAFGPIVELCGGTVDDAATITRALLAQIQTTLTAAEIDPEERCQQLDRSAARMARKAVELWT